MRFRYSFQKIVDLKVNEKTQAEWMLSEAIGKVRLEEQSLSELHNHKDEMQLKIAETTTGQAKISDLLMLQGFVDQLNIQIENKKTDLEIAQQKMILKQDELVSKTKEEKVWSKARENARIKHYETMQKNEQNQLDEMATNRFKRNDVV